MFMATHSQALAAKPDSGRPEVCQRLLADRRNFQAYFRRRIGSPEDAEDAFQEFSLKVIRAAGTLDQSEKVDAWLGRILRNTLIDHYRRRAVRHRVKEAYTEQMLPDTTDPEPDRGQEPCPCIHDALRRLRPDYSEILQRADLRDEPRDAIAVALGLTTGNVNVRLHRARRALKDELERSCPDCRTEGFLSCAC